MKIDSAQLLANLQQAHEAAQWRNHAAASALHKQIDPQMFPLEKLFPWDGLLLDLYGEWDRENGFNVLDIAPSGTDWSFGAAFTNEQISQMGAALDRMFFVKKSAAQVEALIINREMESI